MHWFKILLIVLQCFGLFSTLVNPKYQDKAGVMFTGLIAQGFLLFGIIYWL